MPPLTKTEIIIQRIVTWVLLGIVIAGFFM